MSAGTWTNWGRSVKAAPTEVARPTSVDGVQEVVRRARSDGTVVKPVGSGHSFSPVAMPEDVQLDVGGLEGVLSVDRDRRRVTFAAGTGLWRVGELLAPYGLALENMGDIDRQTIAGATSTGTHGTGLAFGSLGSRIVAATLVTGTGEVLHVSEDARPDLLPAVRLGIGALGVLVDVTIQCVPAFVLEAVEENAPLQDVLESWRDRIESTDHFEFYWFPHTDVACTKTNTRRAPGETRPLSRVRRAVEDEVLGNGAWWALSELSARVPRTTRLVTRVAAGTMGGRRFSDRSDRVFVTSRGVRFREMEYGVPVDALPSALPELRAVAERHDVAFPVEVRAAAADDAMLSTAHGRDVAYLAVHRYWRQDPTAYFREAESVLLAHDGRPHWGKMHTLGAEDLSRRLPRFDDFVAVRDELDPDRVFANAYTRRVLGD